MEERVLDPLELREGLVGVGVGVDVATRVALGTVVLVGLATVGVKSGGGGVGSTDGVGPSVAVAAGVKVGDPTAVLEGTAVGVTRPLRSWRDLP